MEEIWNDTVVPFVFLFYRGHFGKGQPLFYFISLVLLSKYKMSPGMSLWKQMTEYCVIEDAGRGPCVRQLLDGFLIAAYRDF